MKNALRAIAIYCSAAFLVSCTGNPYEVDVSGIDVPVTVHRFDREIFDVPADSLAGRVPELAARYGQFFDLFSYEIVSPSRGLADPGFSYGLTSFATSYDMREAYEECRKVFGELGRLEDELSGAFRHYRYYFPEKKIPMIIAYMSGFNYSILTDDTILAIGLERYLGPDCKFYPMLQYPKYMTFRMRKEFIAPDAMQAWAMTEFPHEGKRNFLNEIIYRGKLLHFMKSMMPQAEDSLLPAFTASELKWCRANEANLWAHFIEKDLLYSTDEKKIIEYTQEGPFTPGFPEEAPDRSANWMGWEIVKAYARKNDVSLPELMKEQDGQKILERSGYKP